MARPQEDMNVVKEEIKPKKEISNLSKPQTLESGMAAAYTQSQDRQKRINSLDPGAARAYVGGMSLEKAEEVSEIAQKNNNSLKQKKEEELRIKNTSIYDKYKNPNKSHTKTKAVVDRIYNIPENRKKLPLTYFDNVDYPFRILDSAYNFRIGDCQFKIPPEFIQVKTVTEVNSNVGIRQMSSVKTKSGYQKKQIVITLFFNGIDQINGFKVESPFSYPYYMDGLRSLLAQFRRTPFLPVVNELLNDAHSIHNVALSGITINTVQGFPECLQVDITLMEFNAVPYIEAPQFMFQSMIDWDLFRWYYQQVMRDDGKAYGREDLNVKLSKISESGLTNKFSFSLLSEKVLSGVTQDNEDQNVTNPSNYIEVINDEMGISLSDLYCGYQNILPQIQLSKQASPCTQFIGGMDAIFTFIFETQDRNIVHNLTQMNEKCQELVRTYRKLAGLGFIKVENELVQLLGCQYVMINNMDITTVPDFPDLFRIQMECVSYDIDQSKKEKLNSFKPFDGKGVNSKFELGERGWPEKSNTVLKNTWSGLFTKIKQDRYAEEKLRYMELYPDLQLPKYNEVNNIISVIRDYKSRKGLAQLPYSNYPMEYGQDNEELFVDPDFYVFYPFSYKDSEGDSLKDKYGMNSGSAKGDTISSAQPRQSSNFLEILKAQVGAGYAWGGNGQILTNEAFLDLKAIHGEGHLLDLAYQKWSGMKVWDCSGFVSWGLREAGIAPQGYRSNHEGVFNAYASEISKDQMIPGDLMINSGHIAVYIGDGKTVEALDTAHGVVFGTVGNRFTKFGRLKGNSIASYTDNYGETNTEYTSGGGATTGDVEYTPPTYQASRNPHAVLMINKVKAGAIKCYNEIGILPSITIAQAALETGWGESQLAKEYNNIFGVKVGGGWNGKVTHDIWDGQEESYSKYRWYDSWDDCMEDRINKVFGSEWGRFNYAKVIAATDYKKAAYYLRHEINAAYATDPQYDTKLINLIKEWNLDQFDQQVLSGKGKTPSNNTVNNGTDLDVGNSFANLNLDLNEFGKPIYNVSDCMEQGTETKNFNSHTEDQYPIEHMCVDMKQYNKRGRLCRAFPTYILLFMDENGDWLDGRKIWTNYYVYNSAVEINIHQERSQPVHTATVKISNVYNNLGQAPKSYDWIKESLKDNTVMSWAYNTFGIKLGTPKVTQGMIDQKNKLLKHVGLDAGCRIHIRLGYGSDSFHLPICFTGTIAEIDTQDIVTFVAQSDGSELTNQAVGTKSSGQTNTLFTLGTEPSNIVMSMLTDREAWFLPGLNNKWFENSKYGIQHFGTPTLRDDTALVKGRYQGNDWKDLIPGYDIYKDMTNDPKFSETMDKIKESTNPVERAAYSVELLLKKIGDMAANPIENADDWLQITQIIGMFTLSPATILVGGVAQALTGNINLGNLDFPEYYDIIKNIYLGGVKADGRREDYAAIHMNTTGDWAINPFDGEENLRMFIYNKCIWDILQITTQSIPEFICQPMYHQFDSRVFFGHPFWQSKYAYNYNDTTESLRMVKAFCSISYLRFVK